MSLCHGAGALVRMLTYAGPAQRGHPILSRQVRARMQATLSAAPHRYVASRAALAASAATHSSAHAADAAGMTHSRRLCARSQPARKKYTASSAWRPRAQLSAHAVNEDAQGSVLQQHGPSSGMRTQHCQRIRYLCHYP